MKTKTPIKPVTVNPDQRLFVIPCGSGYSCLGFDVCRKRSAGLAAELGEPEPSGPVDSFDSYQEYSRLCEIGRARNIATKWRSAVELTPQLNGLEGKRVEVVDCYGETRRFIVGKSTGWMPVHLEIKRRDSTGGGAVTGAPFQSVRRVA